MFALCIVLIVVVSRLPDDNPLKRILTALSYRLGTTIIAGGVSPSAGTSQGSNAINDMGGTLALSWRSVPLYPRSLHSTRGSGRHRTRRISASIGLSEISS